LNWMKRLLQVRSGSQAFGRGTLRFIRPGNRHVLVYLRQYGDDTILCVANLSRCAQPAELDLVAHKGAVPIELLGRAPFPPVGDLPYLLTLPGYAFYWFCLSREAEAPPWHGERLAPEDLPVMVLVQGWSSFFPERVAPWRQALASGLRAQLEGRVVSGFLAAQRWAPPAGVARVRQQAAVGVLADAGADEDFCRSLVEAIAASQVWPTRHGQLRCHPTSTFAALRGMQAAEAVVAPAGAQGGNTTVRVGELFLKICRKLQPGINPGVEIGRYLTEVAHFPNCVPLAGFIEYRRGDGATCTLALLQAFVTNQGDGWDYTVNHLVRFLEERVTGGTAPADAHGLHLALMRTLATRTAQLHGALAAASSDPAFAPEPISAEDLGAWSRATRAAATATLQMLAERAAALPPAAAAEAVTLLAQRAALLRSIGTVGRTAPRGVRTRCH